MHTCLYVLSNIENKSRIHAKRAIRCQPNISFSFQLSVCYVITISVQKTTERLLLHECTNTMGNRFLFKKNTTGSRMTCDTVNVTKIQKRIFNWIYMLTDKDRVIVNHKTQHWNFLKSRRWFCVIWQVDKFKSTFCSNLFPFSAFKLLLNANITTFTPIIRSEFQLIQVQLFYFFFQ